MRPPQEVRRRRRRVRRITRRVEWAGLLQRRAGLIWGIAVLASLVGFVLAWRWPSIVAPTPWMGAGMAAGGLATGLLVGIAADVTDPLVRGARHVRGSGAELVGVLPPEASSVSGAALAATITAAASNDGGALKVALTAARTGAFGVSPWTEALGMAVAEQGSSVLVVDLVTGLTDRDGAAEVAAGRRKLSDVARLAEGLRYARIGPGRDHERAIEGLCALMARLPRDLDVVLVALPPMGTKAAVEATACLDTVLVVAERDRTTRLELLSALEAVAQVRDPAQVVLFDGRLAAELGHVPDLALDVDAPSPRRGRNGDDDGEPTLAMGLAPGREDRTDDDADGQAQRGRRALRKRDRRPERDEESSPGAPRSPTAGSAAGFVAGAGSGAGLGAAGLGAAGLGAGSASSASSAAGRAGGAAGSGLAAGSPPAREGRPADLRDHDRITSAAPKAPAPRRGFDDDDDPFASASDSTQPLRLLDEPQPGASTDVASDPMAAASDTAAKQGMDRVAAPDPAAAPESSSAPTAVPDAASAPAADDVGPSGAHHGDVEGTETDGFDDETVLQRARERLAQRHDPKELDDLLSLTPTDSEPTSTQAPTFADTDDIDGPPVIGGRPDLAPSSIAESLRQQAIEMAQAAAAVTDESLAARQPASNTPGPVEVNPVDHVASPADDHQRPTSDEPDALGARDVDVLMGAAAAQAAMQSEAELDEPVHSAPEAPARSDEQVMSEEPALSSNERDRLADTARIPRTNPVGGSSPADVSGAAQRGSEHYPTGPIDEEVDPPAAGSASRSDSDDAEEDLRTTAQMAAFIDDIEGRGR